MKAPVNPGCAGFPAGIILRMPLRKAAHPGGAPGPKNLRISSRMHPF